jgi:hypothetical protein
MTASVSRLCANSPNADSRRSSPLVSAMPRR